jgi:hypothetical protein
MRVVQTVVLLAIIGIPAWMSFDNVFSSNSAVRELAEQAACAKKKCSEAHRLSDERRSPWSQSFEYAWRDATVVVTCRRAYYAIGERTCVAE